LFSSFLGFQHKASWYWIWMECKIEVHAEALEQLISI
jgi:hypothetical protein